MSQSFRSKHLLALQIDNGVTQIAELRVHAKSISVIQSFSLLTPAGTVEDDGTLVADASFAALLREQIRAHGIKTDRPKCTEFIIRGLYPFAIGFREKSANCEKNLFIRLFF